MSVENPQNTNSDEIGSKPCNGDSLPINGLSNGHVEMNGSAHEKSSSSKHKSSSKDKYRDKDRERDRDKDRDKSSKNSSSKDYSKSSSSSKDKYRDKERDKNRDKERDKNRDKERDKDREHNKNREKDSSSNKDKSSSDKHKSSSSSNHKSSNKDRDREKDKDRHRDKDKERSSNKDKEKSSRSDKERSSKDDKPKESNDKDRSKENKTSSKDKERSSDKDKHRSDRDKDRHKSSSTKDKHSSSSGSKSKDKDRERDKDKDRSKDKDRDKDRDRRDKDKHRRSDKEKAANHNSATATATAVGYDPNSGVKLENGYANNNGAAEQMMINNCNFNGINEIYIKEENVNRNHFITENLPNTAKHEVMNSSQASSCDYSMSQFREDESAFAHRLNVDESQNNFDDASQDPIANAHDENDYYTGGENGIKSEEFDEEDVPLAKRKAPNPIDDDDDEEDLPLSSRKKVKKEVIQEDSEEDTPLLARKKIKKQESDEEDLPLANRKSKTSAGKKKKRIAIDDDEDFDEKPKNKKVKAVATRTAIKTENISPTKGGNRKKKAEEEPEDVWRWWEEEKRDDSIKWNFLEHKGPMFPPDYERLPSNVRFYYDGKPITLSNDAEEIACFYAKMINHDYVTKKVFNDNFFKDWRKSMTQKEKDVIKDLGKCNFKEMNDYFTAQSEKNKNRTKQEKQALKEQNEAIVKEYGFCTIDGHKEKIGNFRLEPPGLFRGRGEHPKMGMVKKRLRPEDIIINCSKNSSVPKPPAGRKWKEVKHDNTVTWLASWIENVQGQGKYIMLNPSSKIKGEKDFQKYETARRLDKHINKIRDTYKEEWKSKEMKIRQRAVALYFIDKLALRAGNEKDEDQADTVGCCSLRVEHVELHKEMDGKENVVVFDFLGKDSIRYYNAVPVEKRVFKNLELFKENKKEGDELFDRLNTSILNEHLRDLMEGLTAKVFRTYNASITLQRQLDLLTEEGSSIPEKMLAYNRANRAVAILCNHQRSVPKSHEKSMENLKGKIQAKREAVDEAEADYINLKKDARRGSVKEKIMADKKLKQLERLKEQLKKLELQETDRDENKTIALGTSKLNYLDPRISVAWCKKHDVPIEKIFNKTQRDKFRWAIHMATEEYRF